MKKEAILDTVVIGSGFAGSVISSRLTEAGIPVTLLERGPWRDTIAVRSAGIDETTPFPRGSAMFTSLIRNLRLPRSPRLTLNPRGLFDIHIDKGTTVICSSNVGGGSHVYSAVHRLPHVPNFWDGHAEGVSNEIMQTHYDLIIKEMGLVLATPELGLPNTTNKRYAGSEILETPALDGPTWLGFLFPQANEKPKLTVDSNGLSRYEIDLAANDDGFFGSPRSSKTTVDVVYLIPAMRRGLKIRDLCEVNTVEALPEGSAARYAVNFFDYGQKTSERLLANNVILAAGGINTLRILLRSRDKANTLSGMPKLGSRFGLNGDFIGWWNQKEYGDQTAGLPSRGSFRLRSDKDHPILGGGALPSIAHYPLPKILKKSLSHYLWIAGMGVDAMDGTVSWRRRDIRINFTELDSPFYVKLSEEIRSLEQKSGKRIYHPKNATTIHPIGGACLGATIENGVINNNGEVFGYPGMYITDGSALPQEPGGPPSLTIAAWSSYVASRFIAKRFANI